MNSITNKEVLKIVSIADIHFGALDPQYQYTQLKAQFIDRLRNLDFDILEICGDLFDSKYMGNNPIISYALLFIDEVVKLCREKQATILLLSGTESHDSGQLSLFYYYLQDPTIDLRIIEKIQFELVKGLRVLCIPEKYGIPEEEYENVLYKSGAYDLCILHGTLKGSVFGANVSTLNSTHAPIFCLNNFCNCRGPIICGHVHVAGVFEEYMYYNGSPLRFSFGEEQTKGFLITLYNRNTRMHYTELVPIDSYIYNTINIDHLINEDPKKIIQYIKEIKESKGIDFIRVQFNNSNENMNVVRAYFRNIGNVKLQELNKNEKQHQIIDQQVLEQNQQYSYILDKEIDDYSKFVMYINQNEGFDFISVDELVSLLEEKI